VWPVVVVVLGVPGQHGCGVPLVGDEDAAEEFAADAADEAFGDRVGPRRPNRCSDDADVDCGEHRVEHGGELASRSRMRNRKRRAASSRSMARLRACWVSQAPVGWAVTPRMCTRGGVLDDEERVEPVQGDGVEVEQVAGEDRVRLGSQELGP
jgi:hypothetical protein